MAANAIAFTTRAGSSREAVASAVHVGMVAGANGVRVDRYNVSYPGIVQIRDFFSRFRNRIGGVLRGKIQGITKPAIRRLARRGARRPEPGEDPGVEEHRAVDPDGVHAPDPGGRAGLHEQQAVARGCGEGHDAVRVEDGRDAARGRRGGAGSPRRPSINVGSSI